MGEEKNIRTVHVEPRGDGYRVTIGGCRYEVERVVSVGPGQFNLLFHSTASGPTNTWPLRVYTAHDGPKRFIALNGMGTYAVQRAESARKAHDASASAGSLEAGMPGQIRAILVREGETVTRGQTLVVLEAMKMELKVQAPFAGHVRRLLCQLGQIVERGQTLVEVEAGHS